MIATASHVQTDRIVFTWVPVAWPAGVLTGVADELGGFRLEHVVAFDRTPGSALALVRAGLAEAWLRRFEYVLFRIPHAHPHARGLKALARRVGGHEYHVSDVESFFVVYAPEP